MGQNFIHLDLPKLEFREYFLNNYIPKNNILEKIQEGKYSYYQHHIKDSVDESMIRLEKLLLEKYSLPLKVEYFSIFYHTRPQSIHVDSNKIYRYSSLNLPLENFHDSKMLFYRFKNKAGMKVSDAFYPEINDLELTETLHGTDEWVLVDSSVPHAIIADSKRITLCVRFNGNPKFDAFKKRIESKHMK